MRILYVLPSLLHGGAEALVSQWARYLQAAGHEAEICTLYTAGPLALPLERLGIKVWNLNHDPGIERYRLRRKYDPRLLRVLRGVIRSGSYEVVHAHLFPCLVYAALASLLERGPAYVYSEHSIWNRRRGVPLLKNLDRALYRRYHRILPVSEAVSKALRAWIPELDGRIRVVPNMVSSEQFAFSPQEKQEARRQLGLQENERVLLYAGRLVPAKGPDVLARALCQLEGQLGQPLRVLFAGEGPLKGEVRRACLSLPPNLKVDLLGNRGDIPLLLSIADAAALPSRWEGLPMFLLEAMASGTAILATAVGGIPEVIEHQASGWLVEPGDPGALAQGLAGLIEQRELCERLRDNALQVFQRRFSPQATMPRLLAVYAGARG